MRFRIAVAVTVTIIAGSVPADAAGINLSWNDCGDYGTQNQTFDCASNSGMPFIMYASFYPPPGIDEFVAFQSRIDIFTDQANLPDWWRHGTAQCRGSTGLSVSLDFVSGPYTCADFFQGQGRVSGFLYQVGVGSSSRARLSIEGYTPYENRGPLDPNLEYYAYKVSLLRSKSTGANACAGCLYPTCILLVDIQLGHMGAGAYDPVISNPASRSFVTWQPPPGGPAHCPQSTTSRGSTWGQVRSLYR